jgi:perosamine synthetase
MHNINFFNTYISGGAFDRVKEVLQNTFLSEGKIVAEFEKALTTKMGIINPVTLNSGTAALHLALVVAGIGHADEVIIPAQTFIATGLAVMMTGATPVFADIQYATGNIDPQDVLLKISKNTKAIIPVHWGGYPCDMDELNSIAREHNLLIIEDAAHAIGATYKSNCIGSISDMTCFSFQAIKHLTTGDGGALACKNAGHFEKAMALRWFGIDRKNTSIGLLGEREYDLTELGYKYHLNNYAAALGIANIETLATNLKRRREIASLYDTELENVKGIQLLNYKTDRQSAYWLYGFHVENRVEFMRKLQSVGIPASVVHVGIQRNQVFTHESKHSLPIQNKFDNTQVHIPVHNELNDEHVFNIVNTIKSGW